MFETYIVETSDAETSVNTVASSPARMEYHRGRLMPLTLFLNHLV
ncbi:hypothetical protein P4S72_18815 [Vibrio sp. PP-XX7]